jgi:hypothetical protein
MTQVARQVAVAVENTLNYDLGEHPKPAIDDHLKTGQR